MQNPFNLKIVISVFLLLAVSFVIIVLVGTILTPFLIALILAYILNPLVENLNRKLKIRRDIVALIISILVFLIFIAVPVFVFPLLAEQIKIIASKAPDIINSINNNLIAHINLKYDTNFNLDFDLMRQAILQDIAKNAKNIDIFGPIAKNGVVLAKALLYVILVPFVLFYTIKNWHAILAFFDSFIPRSYLRKTHVIIKEIDRMMSLYLRGQLSVMLIMALYYGTALYLVNLTSGIMIGIMTGGVVFVPYLGVLAGFITAICVALVSNASQHQIILILLIFALGHLLEGGLVTPFLIGGKIGLNPVLIILALMIFGKAFGLVGVLLALPLSTIAVVILKYVRLYYMRSRYYQEH